MILVSFFPEIFLFIPVYYPDGNPFSVIFTYKNLGVTVDSKLRFNCHYVDILSRAYRMSGFVLCSSYQFRDVHSSVILYNSFVRNTLEYASVEWFPYHYCNFYAIDTVLLFTSSLLSTRHQRSKALALPA